jgi:hypothetical protein
MESVMNTATESNGEAPAATKKRKTTDLPQELTRLTEKNFCTALSEVSIGNGRDGGASLEVR